MRIRGHIIIDQLRSNLNRGYFTGRRLTIAVATIMVIIVTTVALPSVEFNAPYSTQLLSKNGELMGAQIAADGQWRFKMTDSSPYKFNESLIAFEDRWFYYHTGIDISAVARALYLNIRAGSIKSGASTITMQTVRLNRGGRGRTIKEKIIEGILALKLELTHSKSEILDLYAERAPFGGNVVGIEAAAWRYYGLPAKHLSWGESAALAVLPNAPSLIFPGRGENRYLKKRDIVLKRLLDRAIIDSTTYSMALLEPLPGAPKPLPRVAPHLLDRVSKESRGEIVRSTIDLPKQIVAKDVIDKHKKHLQENHIDNIAAIIVEVESGNIISYIGNGEWSLKRGEAIDMVKATRSTGSLLKPILYAALLDGGIIMPNTLLPDLPIHLSGYSPKNFDLKFRGAVPASQAISQSLNIPSVEMLRRYSTERFLHLLKELGVNSFTKGSDYYGLSLILGGGEASLEEMVSSYASMARILNRNNPKVIPLNYRDIGSSTSIDSSQLIPSTPPLSAASIWHTFEALLKVNRPLEETGWQYLSSSKKIAWKTGTSFGFKDGWAVGVTPKYAVGVWVGNATGEGRPHLTGVTAAAPVLFELFSTLNIESPWFQEPSDLLYSVEVCRESGHISSSRCNNIDTIMVPERALTTTPCPYHRTIHLDSLNRFRVDGSNYPISRMNSHNWFILPPDMEYYYRKSHPEYIRVPPIHTNSINGDNIEIIKFIYPSSDTKLFIPKGVGEEVGSIIFEAADRTVDTTLYWYLDDRYIGESRSIHQMESSPSIGWHNLYVIDSEGNSCRRRFEIVQ